MSGAGGAAGTQEEDKKPMDQSAHINLKVKGQILIKKVDALTKAMEIESKKMNREATTREKEITTEKSEDN